MSFQPPKLDDRTFQQIVDEAKKRIALYCPDWTDHNVSDPGVTLIELFAYMMEMLLYRVNQIPERHFLQFAQWLGIKRHQPKAARVPVTFWLTQAPLSPLSIEQQTMVATTQTEMEPSQEYVLEAPFQIAVPALARIVTYRGNQSTVITVNENGYFTDRQIVEVFSPRRPVIGDRLYLGFDKHNLSQHLIHLNLTTNLSAAGGGRRAAPYEWAAFTNQMNDNDLQNEQNWQLCEMEDSTENMNKSGTIALYLPKMQPAEFFGQGPFQWLRLRLIANQVYTDISPIWQRITVATVGFTTSAIHAQEQTRDEYIGTSNGLPGQRFQLRHTPVFTRLQDEFLAIRTADSEEAWHEVNSFAHSTSAHRHYTVDSFSGEICLGPAIRAADGKITQFGAIPPAGAELFFKKYRYGPGGAIGNVDMGKINTLKTSNPNIKRVLNRAPATGGADAESQEEFKHRITHQLATPQRAITAEDFEFLATKQFNHDKGQELVGRAWCLPAYPQVQTTPTNGGMAPSTVNPASTTVNVYILSSVRNTTQTLTQNAVVPSPELQHAVQLYLQRRCLVTTAVQVATPKLYWVSAFITLHTAATVDRTTVSAQVKALATNFLSPFTSGSEGKGWPLGRALQALELYTYLRAMLVGTIDIRQVELWRVDPNTNLKLPGLSEQEIAVDPDGLIVPSDHEVRFI